MLSDILSVMYGVKNSNDICGTFSIVLFKRSLKLYIMGWWVGV